MRQHGWDNNDALRELGQELHSSTAWMTTRALDPRCGEDDGRGKVTRAGVDDKWSAGFPLYQQ